MIILVEGPRGVGKSHLINNFFAQNKDDRFIYYKWNFAEWSKILKLDSDGTNIHYFSVANILTIFDMSETIFKDKILVLDRSIFSAYAWTLYRKRLSRYDINYELGAILSPYTYKNCKLIYMNRDERIAEYSREKKDMFDEYENYALEKQQFDELFNAFRQDIISESLENSMTIFNNSFNIKSQTEFNNLLYSFIDK